VSEGRGGQSPPHGGVSEGRGGQSPPHGGVSEGRGGQSPPLGGVSEGRGGFGALRIPHAYSNTSILAYSFLPS